MMPSRPISRLAGRLHQALEAFRLIDAPDTVLLDRFRQDKDPIAFEALVRRHGRLVLSASRKVLIDEADVEDAFQATFVTLLNDAQGIQKDRSVGSWLYGVAHRMALRITVANR